MLMFRRFNLLLLAVALCAIICAPTSFGDERSAQRVKPFRHTVRTGDTASQLAQKWRVPEDIVAKPGTNLKVGQVLMIALVAMVRIKKGEPISASCDEYSLSIETLRKINHVAAPYRLKAGQLIMIPQVNSW
jgi:LysM repeat protein